MKSRKFSGGSIRTEITRVKRRKRSRAEWLAAKGKTFVPRMSCAVTIWFSVPRTNPRLDFKSRPTAVADVRVGPWNTRKKKKKKKKFVYSGYVYLVQCANSTGRSTRWSVPSPVPRYSSPALPRELTWPKNRSDLTAGDSLEESNNRVKSYRDT